MCDFPGNWTAWMDRELAPEESERMRQHLENCAECRDRFHSYLQVSVELGAFCEEQWVSRSRRTGNRWMPAVYLGGATAAVVAMLLLAAWPRVQTPAHLAEKSPVSISAVSPEQTPAAPAREVERARRRQAPAAIRQVQRVSRQVVADDVTSATPSEPVIEISIPGDELFPPGAVPPGMRFAAYLSIAPDGSADRMRVQPRLTGFERRTSIP